MPRAFQLRKKIKEERHENVHKTSGTSEQGEILLHLTQY